jgi:hypothetical protein
MVKRDQLERTIENVGDKDLTEEEQQELNETKEELRDVMKQEKLFRTSGNVRIAIEKSSRGDITFEDFNNAEDMNAYARQQKLKGWNEKNSANHGVVLFDPKTKKEIILINNEISLEDGQVNVGAHEFLHTVLRNTVQNSKGTAVALGNSLTQYLEKIDASQVDANSAYGKRLAAYNNDPKAIKAEEKLTLFSDAIANGDIKFNESIFTKIGDSIRRALQAAGLKAVKFNNGRDVYNFIKDYNKSIEKGKGLTKAQEALLEGRAEGELVKREYRTKDMLAAEQAMEGKLSRKLTPEQDKQSQNKVAEIKKLKQEGEAIAERFNKPFQPGAKQIKLENELRNDIKPVVDSFVENRTKALFDPIPADAKKGVSRKDFIQSMKSDIETMIINEFEGKQNLEKFIVNRGYLRANSLAERLGVKSVEEGISKDMEAAAKVAAEEVSVETKEKARKPGPRESRQYTPAFEEGLGIETEGKTTTEINEEINKQFDEAISKDLAKIGEVVSFGQTKNIGDAVGALMEKATGMPAKVFTDKTKNIAKKDVTSGAYTNVKQYLDKNAQRDFELLPDAFAPDTGKATFIPENVKKALYKKNDKGQFILDKSKTLKDYKELLGDIKSEKPVYRAAEAQTIKGLIALSLRNRIFEQAVPDAAARSTTGVKFSKRPVQTIDEVGKSKLAEVSNLKNINQVTSALDIKNVSITNENRVQKQKDVVASIEQHGLDLNTFESASFANSGRQYKKVNGVKVFELVDGTKVKDGSAAYNKAVQEGTFLPARGRLYYGVTDPAYKAAKQAAINNTPKDALKPKRVTIKKGQKINSDFISKNKDQSNVNMKVLGDVANQLAEAVQNGMPIEIAATFISQGYQATRGLIKIAAPFKYVSEKFEYAKDGKASDKTGEKFREEHNPPASVVGASLIWAIQNNAVAPVMKAIRDNYSQTQLSKSDDTKLDQAKLASTLPEGKSILDNPVSRMTEAGINLNTIIDPVTGKSLAEINNVGVSIKASKTNPNVVAEQNKLIDSQLNEEIDSKQAKARIKSYEVIAESKLEAGGFNVDTFGDKVNTDMTVEKQVESLETYDNAAKFSRRSDNPVKKIRVFDFDDTLARSKSMVIVNMPDGSSREINATQFASEAADLQAQGAEFDFTQFSQVIDGKKGPLFNVAKTIAEKRGTEDLFILTARPANSAVPIQNFMKAMGIDIPLKNITGLGDGTAAAKGRWVAGKVAEGYNDFYFADDATKNVQAVKEVLDQTDVKSKVQIAKASKRAVFDEVFNDIIEKKTGIESYKNYSAAKAKTVGANKGKFTFFTTPSAEDFVGLLYKMLGKGKVGDAQMAFLKTNLIDPYNRAEMAISQAKVAAGRDYKELKKKFKSIPKTLEKQTGIAKFTYQHAIRTYIWNSQGIEVPGLSKRDQKRLTDFVKADPDLQTFADQLVGLQKGKPYPKPDKDWTAGNITTDVISGINKVNRAEYLQEWQENVDIIFSDKNMNKLEAAFGPKYVEALKDSLRAMKSGSNRPLGGDRVSNAILDWLNNSVGAIMFLNTRSAVLQTISAVNFINWGDNNILKAGKAFVNQKQFWGDFLTLMNSDYLLERRDGLKINVSESEIADAVEGSDNKVKAAISYLLNKGFVLTRYADSFAIASGGATFYRNRIESLVEQGMDRKAAEQQAFEDFRLIAEENQQSSSPMRISQQQRSLIGRIVLQFGNTQLQYVRIQKRAVQDLVNGRGDWRANISKIVYYGAIQNIMFNALQSGLAWALFDDDEDDEELTEKNKEQKLTRTLNGAIDSQLKGLGIQGAVVAGIKNALMTIAEQADKKSPKFEEALDDLLSIAPALGSKIRKLKSAARTVSWNRKEIKEKGFDLDNPAYLAGAQTISALFNIPLDRAVMKMNNLRNVLNPATENWQKVALTLGWSGWDVGLPYFGLAEDKPVLTETEKQTKKLFDLNKSDQVKMLLDLGLTKKEIRALTKEDDRVKEIINLQNKKKNAGSKK